MLFISEYLHKGAENAQTAKELCSLLHIDKRALTIAIERERRQGQPICANSSAGNQGYFLASNKEEMKNYCDRLHHRAAEIYKTRQACLKLLDGLPEKDST